MKRAEKAERIHKILDRLYPQPPVPLDHVDPFSLLVAVLLSAQCTDERVNQVTPASSRSGRALPRGDGEAPVPEDPPA